MCDLQSRLIHEKRMKHWRLQRHTGCSGTLASSEIPLLSEHCLHYTQHRDTGKVNFHKINPNDQHTAINWIENAAFFFCSCFLLLLLLLLPPLLLLFHFHLWRSASIYSSLIYSIDIDCECNKNSLPNGWTSWDCEARAKWNRLPQGACDTWKWLLLLFFLFFLFLLASSSSLTTLSENLFQSEYIPRANRLAACVASAQSLLFAFSLSLLSPSRTQHTTHIETDKENFVR